MTWIGRQWRRISIDTWRVIDRDGRSPDDGGFDLGTMVVLLATALALTIGWYADDLYVKHVARPAGLDQAAWRARVDLVKLVVTSVSCLVIPVLVRACVPGLRALDHVRAAGRLAADPRAWAALVAGVAPALWWRPHVTAIGSHAWTLYGALYAVSLAALIVHLFGYVVATLRPRFGGHAAYVALIPFAMFNYGRAHGEVAGVIAAAAVLLVGDLVRPLGAPRASAVRETPLDRRTVAMLLLVTVSLTAQEYLGDRSWSSKVFVLHASHHWYQHTVDPYWDQLYAFVWWAGWRVLGYLVFPALALTFFPGVRLRDQHLSVRGTVQHLGLYLGLFAAVFPLVWIASHWGSFQETYPFYKLANRSPRDLWSWEGLYAAQFLSLEFFFRGVILQTLRKVAGSNAIFVMIVPYCMIHYGKPMPETLGAIGAGLILGTLAMRTRSIWGGVLLHVGVAVSMDMLALTHCPPPDVGACGEQ
jgi:CAAX protease family protein